VREGLEGIVLVRHGAVASDVRGRCYGRSDVELSPEGIRQHRDLVDRLSSEFKGIPIGRLCHSGMTRTRHLAVQLGTALGIPVSADWTLRERDFGSWELMSWDDLHQDVGDQLVRVISDPANFRPGGGETTHELRDRIWQWYATRPRKGWEIAVTHGGPIAALLGTLRGLPVEEWISLIPEYGGVVYLPEESK
jgi:broad specificity phosphatase PhoE